MELRYRFTDEDALNAYRIRSKQPWTMFLFLLLLALMFLVGIFLINHELAAIGWLWLTLSAALGIAVYEVPRFQIRRAMRGNPSMQGEIVLRLSDEGTEFTYATGKSQLQWRAYTKYKETTHLFVLYVSTSGSTFIPKRAMSPQQIKDLRSLLNARIPATVTPK
jgi:YcxB-like protein